MIDWVKATGPNTVGALPTSRIQRVSADGEITSEYADWERAESSSASTTYGYKATPEQLWLTGNPVKGQRGHNINDDRSPVHLLSLLHFELGISTPNDWEGWHWQRLDITQTVYIGPDRDLWMHNAQRHARIKHRNTVPKAYKGSVYFSGSRGWNLKAYCKDLEVLRDKTLTSYLRAHYPGLLEYLSHCVRVEVSVSRQELKRFELDTVTAWVGVDHSMELWREYTSRLQMPEQIAVTKALDTLPTALYGHYAAWLRGIDLRERLSRPQWFRVRKALLVHGVDIAQPPKDLLKDAQERTIQFKPVSALPWADFRKFAV